MRYFPLLRVSSKNIKNIKSNINVAFSLWGWMARKENKLYHIWNYFNVFCFNFKSLLKHHFHIYFGGDMICWILYICATLCKTLGTWKLLTLDTEKSLKLISEKTWQKNYQFTVLVPRVKMSRAKHDSTYAFVGDETILSAVSVPRAWSICVEFMSSIHEEGILHCWEQHHSWRTSVRPLFHSTSLHTTLFFVL